MLNGKLDFLSCVWKFQKIPVNKPMMNSIWSEIFLKSKMFPQLISPSGVLVLKSLTF